MIEALWNQPFQRSCGSIVQIHYFDDTRLHHNIEYIGYDHKCSEQNDLNEDNIIIKININHISMI